MSHHGIGRYEFSSNLFLGERFVGRIEMAEFSVRTTVGVAVRVNSAPEEASGLLPDASIVIRVCSFCSNQLYAHRRQTTWR